MHAPESPNIRITIDPYKCVGSTMCIQVAPRTFQLNDRKQSMVADPSGEALARLREAAEQCPTGAITLADAATGQVIFPD